MLMHLITNKRQMTRVISTTEKIAIDKLRLPGIDNTPPTGWRWWLAKKIWAWLEKQPWFVSIVWSWMHGRRFIVERDIPIEKPEYVTIDLDTPDLFNALYREMNEVYRVTNKRPAYLVVGNAQMAKLWRLGSDMVAYGTIPLSGPGIHNKHPTLFDCRIICVPWIDGMFFLPDFEKA